MPLLARRTCVLPHLLAAVLPYASPGATAEWLHALTQVRARRLAHRATLHHPAVP